MRGLTTEYTLKGIFLGLLLYVALQASNWTGIGLAAMCLSLGAAAGLLASTALHLKDLKRFQGKWFAFLLYVLLERPILIYAGVLLGMYAASLLCKDPSIENKHLAYCAVGGAVLGLGLGELRKVRARWPRFALSMAVGAGLIFGVLWWLDEGNFLGDANKEYHLGFLLLVGIPFFYLLVFCGEAEESEVEIAALCAVLGIAIHLIMLNSIKIGPWANAGGIMFFIPLALYCMYSLYVLPGLRVFKHTLRGYSYHELDRTKDSLVAFRRALELDPKNELAKEGLWKVHRGIDIGRLAEDPETLKLLDIEMCVNRTAMLLTGNRVPGPEQLAEVRRLIELVEHQEPRRKAQTDYYRAIASLHERQLDHASELLTAILDPSKWGTPDPARDSILFGAWQLCLLVHPGLKERVGESQLRLPGRRIEAIRSAERELAANPLDTNASALRETLYAGLTAPEYEAAAGASSLDNFDYNYSYQLGKTALEDAGRWERGVDYFLIAARGNPPRMPGLYERIIDACTKQGAASKAQDYRRLLKERALEFGVANLPAEEKEIFFNQMKAFADEAALLENFDDAIAGYAVCTQNEKSGKETLRQLAEMYERKKDIVNALRVTEKALLYDKADKDLHARKDKYYYSLEPATLKEVAEEVKLYFDVDYCVTKTTQLLDSRNNDLEVLDWATHLIELARVMKPNDLVAMVQEARCRLRRGEREEALKLLEDVREKKPSGGDESDWWYFTNKQLGKIYLEEYNRPDLAIPCFRDYQTSPKSGADTVYDLGRSYEANNQKAQALKCFEAVTGYSEHPLRWDAEEAVRRLKS